MKDDLYQYLVAFGQQHLLEFWDELDDERRASLAGQIRGIDFQQLASLHEQYQQKRKAGQVPSRPQRPSAERYFQLGDPANRFAPEEARRRGAEALGAGQVGVNLVAGGRGSRLGFEHPKGMFPIGPVSKHTLLQILIEKILATGRRYGARIPLYLMTSPETDQQTKEFLGQRDYFGLPQDDFNPYCQGTMPAVDPCTGKVMLGEPDRVRESPDGHGGMLAALRRANCLEDMRRRGVRHLFHLQVDNPLVEVCSPEFIGYHLLSQAEMSTQVVAKQTPYDRVGNVVEVDGRLHVIEYSDLPRRLARQRAADGSLLFRLGSIAVHVMDVAFLERMAATADALPFHFARKRVKCLKPGSKQTEPKKRKVIQFERFIFDLMPSAENAIVVEVDARSHFAPLKNAPGSGWKFRLLESLRLAEDRDTPEMVRAQMVALYAEWLRRAGAEVAEGVAVEISPLYALDAAELAKKVPPGTQISEPSYWH